MIGLVFYFVISYCYVLSLPQAQTWTEAFVHVSAALCWPSGFVLWLMEH